MKANGFFVQVVLLHDHVSWIWAEFALSEALLHLLGPRYMRIFMAELWSAERRLPGCCQVTPAREENSAGLNCLNVVYPVGKCLPRTFMLTTNIISTFLQHLDLIESGSNNIIPV